MDSFEWNKIAGWVLAASIAVLGLSIVTGEIYKPVIPEKRSYIVQGVEAEVAENLAPTEAEKPIAFYLASASVDKGAQVFKKCAACHNAEKGGAAQIGPPLYGIMGAPHARTAGFTYSGALSGLKGKPWSWDEMSAWLLNPKAYAAGNKMAFAGLSKPEDRAAVIAYLNAQSDKPLPLPAVPAEAEAPAAAAEPTVAGATPETPPGTPTAEQAAPAAGKAPDVDVGATTANAAKQPDGNRGGPGASDVTGTAATEK